jgi:2,3-bisphosphoglycerate-dependent phosphoglycerate mutase
VILYLMRHGESEANVEHVFSNGRVDLPLTARGRGQAEGLAGWLEGKGAAHVYCAPLRRARETAAIVATHLGLPCTVLQDLDEVRVGDLDGRRDPEAWAVYDAVMAGWRAGEREAAFPGGERFGVAHDRFRAVLEEIARRHPRAEERAVAVGHGGIQLTVLPRLCPALQAGLDAGEIPWALPYASIATLELTPGRDEVTLLGWGETAPAPGPEGD